MSFRAKRIAIVGAGLMASMFGMSAHAVAPPRIVGEIRAPLPGFNGPITIDLRLLGVVTGSSPLQIDRDVQFLVDGQTTATIRAELTNNNGPGRVCVTLTNFDFSPRPGQRYSLRFNARNGVGATGLVEVDYTDTPGGPTVPAGSATCNDPNQRPVANAGPDQTITATAPGLVDVTLDGSGSSDPYGDDITQYIWRSVTGAILAQGSDPRPTIQVALGTTQVFLQVQDDSNLTDGTQLSNNNDQVVITARAQPTVDAGEPQTVEDDDLQPGEFWTISGIVDGADFDSVEWTDNGTVIGTSTTLERRWDDGVHNLRFTARFPGNLVLSDTTTLTILPPRQGPVANAGPDQTLTDVEGDGADVELEGSQSTGPSETELFYLWTENGRPIAETENATVHLDPGTHDLTLTVSYFVGDGEGQREVSDTDTVQIIVARAAAAQPPTANAGEDQPIGDTDGQPGETVTLTGTATDPDGTIARYEWFIGEQSLGTGATLAHSLPDGVSVVMLQVTDNSGLTATDTVQITVAAPTTPIVNAGISQTIEDTDVQSGEMVQLSGSATGTINRYEWFLGDASLGVGQSIRVRLPDGVNLVTLRATNSVNLSGTASVRITVATGVRTVLANIPGLTANEKRLAESLDAACNDILGPLTPVETPPQTRNDGTVLTKGARPPTEAEQSDFAQKCRGLLISRNNAQLKDAMGALLGDDFAAARTQTLLFANTQYASVMDRLIALRGGARGLSLAGLNIMVDGEMIPLAQLQGLAQQLFGGGASSDADGGLWSDKWGLWARGNFSFGSKEDNSLSPSFDADQYALLAGLDYRLTETAVIGGALAFGNSSVDFSGNDGSLDTESWALSLYSSLYAKRSFYFDAIVNVADSSYTAKRNITYVDGYGLVNTDADGDTGGFTMSGGMSAGYDFLIGGLTLSPTLGMFYIDAQIDEFTESNAGGLNLIYDEQQFKSLTGTLGMRATFAWNLPFGVLLPHFRADFVREFEDDVDVFGIRFAADPNAASAPPILIETENPDTSYWRLAAGVSAQFRYGISGYVEYQRLESFRFISFQDVSVGLRFQAAF